MGERGRFRRHSIHELFPSILFSRHTATHAELEESWKKEEILLELRLVAFTFLSYYFSFNKKI